MKDAETAVARALAYVHLSGVWRANHCSNNGFDDFIKERLPEQVGYFDCDAEDFLTALQESGYVVVPEQLTAETHEAIVKIIGGDDAYVRARKAHGAVVKAAQGEG